MSLKKIIQKKLEKKHLSRFPEYVKLVGTYFREGLPIANIMNVLDENKGASIEKLEGLFDDSLEKYKGLIAKMAKEYKPKENSINGNKDEATSEPATANIYQPEPLS